ncbi:hypothetical protein HUO13_19845 [Saccharopolyspora erythraea]|uniref:hypothetical protein n=1 Tax=Saccharopolyspora erythraea TaxID=1836 RepID=UPI001BA909E5|nr:hypothetical protein [Saccharopolyspora erythraea]QUH02758.1 hypothetical protein HUO13_19845 [Saccharopolyspora erythraea]
MSRTVSVRYAAGVVGESRRHAHLSVAPPDGVRPAAWPTYCGLEIPAHLAEVAHQPAGMPCLRCLSGFTAMTPELDAEGTSEG